MHGVRAVALSFMHERARRTRDRPVMSGTIATRLSPETREQLGRLRRRPPKAERDAQKAERKAERAAVDAWLAVNGWQDFNNTTTASCPRCASVGTRFVSRALREGGPRVLRCVDCALEGRQP